MLRTVALAFLLLQAPANPLQQPVKASIQGSVARVGSGDPIERARLSLQRIMPPPTGLAAEQQPPLPPIPPIQTEADGKFIFKDLDPGQYRLRVQRNGYASQEYGQRTPTSAGTTITLTEGQELKDVAFRLTAAATVSGRIRDSKGEVVAGLPVSLLRTTYGPMGRRNLSSVGSAATDDRGEYRIYWVPAGRYLLSAGAANSGFPEFFGPGGGRSVFVDRMFQMTYYPGVTDPLRASVLDLQPEAELSAVDLILTEAATLRIRGRVLEASTGKPPKAATIWLGTQPETGGLLSTAWSTNNTTYNNTTGAFEIRNVIPGNYLVGSTSDVEAAPVNLNFTGTAQAAYQLLESMSLSLNSEYLPTAVTNADVEGVELRLVPGIPIPVRLRLDGQDLSLLNPETRDRIRVRLDGISAISTSVSQAVPFAVDGSATLNNVSPGEYRVVVTLPAPEYYLKEAFLDRVDVLSRSWEINNRTTGTLNVLLSTKSAKLEGRLSDAQSQPVRGNQVVLVPEQGHDRPDLYKTTTTDQNGRYTFRGLTPGSYRLYAWEAIEANSWFDRELLTQYDTQSKRIRLEESASETVDLQIIPAPK